MGNHFLLQGTFPTQGSNRSLPHLLSEPPGKERDEQKAPTSLSAQVTSSSNLRNAPLASRSNFLPHNTFVFPTPHHYPAPDCVGAEGEWVQLQTCHQSEYHCSRHQAISSHTHTSASPPPTPHTSVARDKIGKRQLGSRHAFTLSLTV